MGTMRNKRVNFAVVLLILVLPHVNFASGQQTTNTTCNVLAGDTVHCNSETTNPAAQQQQAFQQGQQFGQALAAAVQMRQFNKDVRNYCAAHPGEDWAYRSNSDSHTMSSGRCPSGQEQVNAAAGVFLERHKEFKNVAANADALWAYIQTRNLDPRQEKSFEHAYKSLRKEGKLDLYMK